MSDQPPTCTPTPPFTQNSENDNYLPVTTAPPAPHVASPRRSRGNKYFVDELLHLFEKMKIIKPIGPDEWDTVLGLHSEKYPGRDVESLRRKYTATHQKKVPTGYPNIPPHIRAAKYVKRMIGDRANLGRGGRRI